MKNKLLMTTALVALVSSGNVYAEDVDRKEIITNSKTLSESVEGLYSTKSNGGVYFVGDTDEPVTVMVDKGVIYKDNSSKNTAGVFSVQKGHTLNIGSGVNFDGNKTVNNGGAIYANEATINIDDNVNFIRNKAENGQGGAIMATSLISVGNSLFEENSAGTDGGAILNALVSGKMPLP